MQLVFIYFPKHPLKWNHKQVTAHVHLISRFMGLNSMMNFNAITSAIEHPQIWVPIF